MDDLGPFLVMHAVGPKMDIPVGVVVVVVVIIIDTMA